MTTRMNAHTSQYTPMPLTNLRKHLHPHLHALRHPSPGPPRKLCPRRTPLKNIHGSHHVDWRPHAILVPLALLVHAAPYVLARIIHPGCTTLFAVNPGILPPVLSHPSMHGCTEAMPQACLRVLYRHWPACAPMRSGTLHTPDVPPASPKSLLHPTCASRTSAVCPGCTISGCAVRPRCGPCCCHVTVTPVPMSPHPHHCPSPMPLSDLATTPADALEACRSPVPRLPSRAKSMPMSHRHAAVLRHPHAHCAHAHPG